MRRLPIAISLAAAAAAFTHGAFAADLPVKAEPKAPSIASDPWSGFYLGATAGGGFGKSATDLTPNTAAIGVGIGQPPVGPFPSAPRMSGFVGGGELGYNWRFGNILAGLEADLSYSSAHDSNSATGTPFIGGIFNTTIDAKLHSFGTVRGRLGWLATNDLLVYGTGGFAYGDAKTTVTGINVAPARGCPNNNCFSGSTGTTSGWTAGGGVEYAFMPHWTVKAEYLYLDFGRHTFVMNDAINVGATVTASTHQTFNVARAGVNYHF